MKQTIFLLALSITSSCWSAGTFELIRQRKVDPAHTAQLTQQQLDLYTATGTCAPDTTTKQVPVYRTLITQDGYQIGYYFFNRNSPTLMIVGPGMLNKAEKLLWVAEKFYTYDIAVMDFRCNADMGNFLLSSDTLKDPKAALLYNVAHDVTGVINHAMLPRHTTITGYGYCYGGWIFALYQTSQGPTRYFDSLIFDSLPQSLEKLLNSILKDADVMGPRNPDKKPGFLQKFTALPIVRKPLTYALTRAFTDFSIAPTLADLDIPTLFIQGKADRVASLGQFYKNFNTCGSSQKFALLTPCEHVENFKHAAPLCTGVCLKFIEGTLSDSL